MRWITLALVAIVGLGMAVRPCDAAGRKRSDEIQLKRSENLERIFKRKYEEENARFAGDLQELARWCAEKGLNDKVAETWEVVRDMDPSIEGEAPVGDAPPMDEDKARFPKKKTALFAKHARELHSLGFKCYKSGLIGRAYDMVWDTIRYDPDHSRARKLLGQVKYKGKWMGVYDAIQLRRGKIFTEEYGWVYEKELEKYKEGLMYLRGRWVPKETVEEIRKSWANAWRYETEHFEIQTNVGLADAVAFGKICEDNYDLFFRVFISYFSPKSQSQMLFGIQRSKSPMRVNYFASQEEYSKSVSGAGGSAGMYTSRSKTSNFFKTNPGENVRVLKHETTHQMFCETRKTRYASQHGAWVVEAAATYMETCYRREGKIVTEGKDAPWAKVFIALLKLDQGVPLDVFDQGDYPTFQARGPIAYPQAAALALFLMEAEDGKYRERFVDYIAAYYAGKLRKSGAIAGYIGVPLDELEREFHLFYLGEEGLRELEELRAKRAEEARKAEEEEQEKKQEEQEDETEK